ncbi:MAG TPA: hypothetical protein V6D17_04195 [Candidatus Obscuribacterales bacterium]
MTQRYLVTHLGKHADVVIATAGDYDFKNGRVRAYRRIKGGHFEGIGMIRPRADLWIAYSDGYYLDHRKLGFKKRRHFLEAQIHLHSAAIASGDVGRMINSPSVEKRTLKSWFSQLDCAKFNVIPTYTCKSLAEVSDLRKEQSAIVAKLNWGGAGQGCVRLSSDDEVKRFASKLEESDDIDLSDYCFQPYLPGDEKRFWFVGGKVVAARRTRGRKTPWSDSSDDYEVEEYSEEMKGFKTDLQAAQHLCRHSGLEVGSIDFLGKRINEINACGTIFVEYKYWQRIVDARPHLVRYFIDVIRAL